MLRLALRILICLAAAALLTFVAFKLIAVNATTVGFAYLLLILIIASTWGVVESFISSIAAALLLNFYFFEPIGKLTIDDPKNWVALFSFFATSLIASRLSDKAKRRALDALERQHDVERLYTFSRAILLIGREEIFPRELVRLLAATFDLSAVVLYERRTGHFYRAGASDFDGFDNQLRDTALLGTSFSDRPGSIVTAVRLGSEPIASLGLEGTPMPDSVLQGIANLVAIGLERARAQDLAHEIEAARQSEQLRTTLIDAMAHEFKTPLTLIKGATTSILSSPEKLSESAREQLIIADEEAEHLRDLIGNAVEMARLDTAHIDVHLEWSDPEKIIRDVLASMQLQIKGRRLDLEIDDHLPRIPLDQRLIKLAMKQLIDNAVKYSPPDSPLEIGVHGLNQGVSFDVTDHGPGIALEDKPRVFERFYRSNSIRNQIPGSGLGLNIASSIVQAHHGDITLTSHPGETVFRMTFRADAAEAVHG